MLIVMRKFITCKHPKASVESHERAAPLHSYNEKRYPLRISLYVIRAIDGARTRGLDLGKVARYQLRHYRIFYYVLSNTFSILTDEAPDVNLILNNFCVYINNCKN